MEKYYLSRKNYEKLREDLTALKEIKAKLSLEIGEAAQQGDLRENAEYAAAKSRQEETLVKIQDLEQKLRNAQITDDIQVDKSEARIGATVTVHDISADIDFTYTLVGSMESNPEKGLLSVQSPLAVSILGKKEGEEFEAVLPKGKKMYKLVKLEYK
ncbi:Transcription elongation factor [Elusimicrobium minutum Pei191]|uniref:Transcription elongation factor GreA n=1 Tax=Elusimicrobium minutum (strain Pei191) TaxID=445932 RepID=B2KBD2_ELUMP|nr:transcription elongation factor GreA [Elusimicrobium minutum]ACC97954.1 Transcription elongation factor [Elusimicrobium minutum Pei191]